MGNTAYKNLLYPAPALRAYYNKIIFICVYFFIPMSIYMIFYIFNFVNALSQYGNDKCFVFFIKIGVL